MLVRDSMVHRSRVYRQGGRLRAGILGALMAVVAVGLVAFGLLGPAGTSSAPKGLGRGDQPSSTGRPVDSGDPDTLDPVLPVAERAPATGGPQPKSGVEGGPTDSPGWTLGLRVLDAARLPVLATHLECSGPDSAEVTWMRRDDAIEFRTDRPGEYLLTIDGPEPDRDDAAPFIAASYRWEAVPGEPDSRAEVVLHRAARIVGSFHCTDGSSPASAGIDIFHVASGEWSNAAAIDDGTFLSSWMPAGEVIVYSRNGSWSDTDLKDREILSLSEGQSHAYHGVLSPAVDLAGTVVDTAGRPLGSVTVRVQDDRNPAYSESVVSEEDGTFLCDGLYPGAYLLELSRSVETPKIRFEVPRGTASVDVGSLVFRKE